MDAVDLPSVIALLVLAAFCLAAAAFTGRRRSRGRTAEQLARRVGLALVPEIEGLVAARIRRSEVLWLLGAAAGSVVGAVLGAVNGPAENPVLLLGLAAAVTGGSLAAGLAAALGSIGRPVDGPRLARSTRVGIEDYIAPPELVLGRLLGFGGALGAVVLGTLDARGPVALDAWTFAALAIVSAVLLEGAGRRIVARPQPSGSSTSLAWDDALRSLDLRALATAPTTAGIWALELAVAPLIAVWTREAGRSAVLVVSGTALALVAASVVLLVLTLASRPQQHFLRRLWPELTR